MKEAALRVVTASGVANVFRPLTRRTAVVFMMHRFAGPSHGAVCHEPATVRALLAYLRKSKRQLIDLPTLFASLRGDGPPLRHAVAFTIDDGYSEHASVAAPLFAEFDCPVTTFITTGFLDGGMWFWWDQIQFVLSHTRRDTVTLTMDEQEVRYHLADPAARSAAAEDFASRCKPLEENERTDAIKRLAADAEVDVPERPTPAFAPMSWDDARRCERIGMSFGPHTVTHPFLGRVGNDRARHEITHSWQRLRSELQNPVPVFAYPNGRTGDFGPREYRVLAESGFLGAVTAEGGFVTRERYRTPNGVFALPRFPLPSSLPYLIQQVNGLERFKQILRGDDSR